MADRRREPRRDRDDDREELDERVVDIKRVAKVIKGGRRFAFRTVVIVGDNKGRVGIGIGKARGVPDSIRKGSEKARKNMERVALSGTNRPASDCGSLWRCAGDAQTSVARYGCYRRRWCSRRAGSSRCARHPHKSQGSANLLNVTMATLDALQQLRSPEQMAAMRGKKVEDVLPFWERAALHQSVEVVAAPEAADE